MVAEVHRYKAGDIEVTVLSDGFRMVPVDGNYLSNATVDDLQKALAAAGQPIDKMKNTYSPIVLTTGGKRVLFDTGNGQAASDQSKGERGTLNAGLAAAGIDRSKIDVVVISHFHADHVNGLLAGGEAFTAVVGTDVTGRVTRVAHIGHKKVVDVQLALDALDRRGHDVTGAHTSRKPNVYQRSALDWISPCCSVAGCDQPRQEIDHRADWADTHLTGLDGLDGLCTHHHWLKTHRGYRLEPGKGRRRLLGPPVAPHAHAPP